MIFQNISSDKLRIHLIEADTRLTCEIVNACAIIGHHCEPYADISEIAAHAPREGIIMARDDVGSGGVAEVLDRLFALGIWLPVIATAFQPTPNRVVQAVKSGTLDYMSLPIQTDRLAASIARISKEAAQVSASRRRMIQARRLLSKLSNRESEVLEGLASGKSNKAIARNLDISPRTVEIHRAKMMTKLGASHSADVIRLKLEARIASVPQFVEEC